MDAGRIEKEDLFATSQRLLRDTRGAAFKAEKQVVKPFAGILEKIRLRKEELERQSRKQPLSTKPEDHGLQHGSAAAADRHRPKRQKDGQCRTPNGAPSEPSQEAAEEPQLPPSGSNSDGETEPGPPLRESTEAQAASMDESKAGPADPSLLDEESLPPPLAETPSQHQGDDESPAMEDSLQHRRTSSLKESQTTSGAGLTRKERGPLPRRASPRRQEAIGRARHFLDMEAQEEDDEGNLVSDGSDDDEDAEDDAGLILECELEKNGEKDEEQRKALHSKWLEEQDEAMESSLLHKVATGNWQGKRKPFGVQLLEADREQAAGDEGEHDDVLAQFVRKAGRVRARSSVDLPAEGSNCAEEEEALENGVEEEDEEGEDDCEVDLAGAYAESEKRRQFLEDSEKQDDFLLPTQDESCQEILGLISRANGFAAKQTSGLPRPTASRGTGGGDARLKATPLAFVGRASSISAVLQRSSGSSNSRSSFVFGRSDSNSQHSLSEPPDPQEVGAAPVSSATFSGKFTLYCPEPLASTSRKGEVSLFGMLKRQSRHTSVSTAPVAVDSDLSVQEALNLMRPVRFSR